MRIALVIVLTLAGFAVGWLLNQAESGVSPTHEPEPVELGDRASPQWKARVEGKSTNEVVTAIYEDTLEATFDEKFDLFQSVMEKDESTSRKLHARMLVMSMDSAELHEAIEQARFNGANRRTMDLLYACLVDRDREAAWSYFLDQPDPDEVSILSYYIFKRWVLEDPVGAMAAWSQLDEHTRETRLHTMVESLAEVDLNAALQLQLDYGQMGSRDSRAYHDIIRKWAQRDMESAKEALALVPRGAHEDAHRAYFEVLIGHDRELAMTQAKALPGFADQKRALRQVYENWLDEDVDAALEALAGEATPEDYFSSWQLSREHPEKVMNWAFENMSGLEQDYLIDTAMRNMVNQEDGLKLAMGHLDTLPYGEAYDRSLSSLAREWAGEDPKGAIAWAQSLEDPSDMGRALRSAISRYARDDPEAAKAMFLQLDQEQRESVDGTLVSNLADRDPLESLAWIDTLPADMQHTGMRHRVYDEWARDDATGLFNHLGQTGIQNLPDGKRRDLVRRYAEYSPKEASAWLQATPADQYGEDELTRMYGDVAGEWLDNDTLEASKWIASLPDGKPRQAAVLKLINEVRRSDPAAAWDWLPEVAEDRRHHLAESVLRDWKDKDAAYNALVKSELSDEDVNKLLKRFFPEE